MARAVGMWKHRAKVGLIVVICIMLYFISIPVVLIAAYNVKTAWGINAMEDGGWHHFDRCLSEELALERQDILEAKYGVLAPLAPLLISWGIFPLPTDKR